ncbi:hypothetical protein HNO89_004424 [Sporosarcina luteola]|nr:hypothetical protein [Sporosarcina luteola]
MKKLVLTLFVFLTVLSGDLNATVYAGEDELPDITSSSVGDAL